MRPSQRQSELPAGVQKMSDMDMMDAAGNNTTLARILRTREVRESLAGILPDVLNTFAGDDRVKKAILSLAGKYLHKLLSRPEDVLGKRELGLLFADQAFVKNISVPASAIFNGIVDAAAAAMTSIDQLETSEKKEFLGELLSVLIDGRTWQLFTSGCRILNDIYRTDPEYLTRHVMPGFRRWFESVDFGEIRELMEMSFADVRAFVRMVNDAMWEYPAKVVLLLSLIPDIVNRMVAALDISLCKFNELPPDLLTDVVLSYIKEIDGQSVAGLVNRLTEFVRKVHTGSALLGEPGTQQLPKLLSTKLNDIAAAVDPVTLWKAKIALAELSASFSRGLTEAVNCHPVLRELALRKGPELVNIRVKTVNRRLSYWETVDDDDLAESLTRHLSAYDTREMAEAANTLIRLFNRLGERNPDVYADLAGQFVRGLDADELAEAGKRILNGTSRELMKAARSVVPGLVVWICGVIAPADDEYEGDAQQAREAFSSLLAGVEV